MKGWMEYPPSENGGCWIRFLLAIVGVVLFTVLLLGIFLGIVIAGGLY